MPTSFAYIPQELQFLGAGKETTWGTGVASTYFIPFKTVKPVDKPTVVQDTGLRGIMANTFGVNQSVRNSTFDIDGEAYPDSIGLFLLSMFGSDAVTGTTNKTHAFTMLAGGQPSPLTLNYFNGYNERAFAGSKCEELDFKWAKNAALEYSAKFSGKVSSVIVTETPSLTALQRFMAWNFALTLNSVANTNLESFELNLKRKSDVIQSANNSQDAAFVLLGGLTATGKATFVIQDDTELALALAGTPIPISFVGTQAGTSYGITFQLTSATLTDPTITGKTHMSCDVNFEGSYNVTDGGPAKVSLINAVTSY